MSKNLPKKLHYRRLENLAKDASEVRRITSSVLFRTSLPMLAAIKKGNLSAALELFRFSQDLAKLGVNCYLIESKISDYLEGERRPLLALFKDLALPAVAGINAYLVSDIARMQMDQELSGIAAALSTMSIILFIFNSTSRERLKRTMEDPKKVDEISKLMDIMKKGAKDLEEGLSKKARQSSKGTGRKEHGSEGKEDG